MRLSSQLRVFFALLTTLLLLCTAPRGAEAKKVAESNAISAPIATKARVAILYFDYSGNDEEMSFLRKGLTQMLVTDLSDAPELILVERTDLEAVLKELELSSSKKLDRASASKIGKLLGAQYLVTGGYFTFKKRMRVDAKIIDVETGVTKGIGVSNDPENFLEMEIDLAAKLHTALIKASKAKATSKTKKTASAETSPRSKTKKVAARTVARYGKALDALDQGNKKLAMKELTAITSETPDFRPAADDLKVLLR